MKKIITILLACCLAFGSTTPAKASCFENEAMGGWSYIFDCTYRHKPLKEPYRALLYEMYMQYHYEYEVTEEERAILERIVEAEATGGNVEQKMNVASCVIARMESREWPDTIGPRGGVKPGKLIEHEVSYIADFVYKDKAGNTIVEDTKGFRTKEYIIKRKLALYLLGIRIREV